MLSQYDIAVIHLCKSRNPSVADFRRLYGESRGLADEYIDMQDVVRSVYDIYEVIVKTGAIKEDNFSLFVDIFGYKAKIPSWFGLKRDFQNPWENLLAILESRISLTEVKYLEPIGYVCKDWSKE